MPPTNRPIGDGVAVTADYLMKQYLLSIYQPDGDPPPPAVLDKVRRDVAALAHSDAPTAAATDWRQILALYNLHRHLPPSPVAVAEVGGPAAALTLVDSLDLDS